MSNKILDTVGIVLNDFSLTAEKLIIAPKNQFSEENDLKIIHCKNKFDINDVLALIGEVKYIGIVSSEKLNKSSLTQLTEILTAKNKATVVMINTGSVCCKVLYPPPDIGTKYVEGNYEYRYCQERVQMNLKSQWTTISTQKGWGVKIIDSTQTDYDAPLSMIQGFPVTNFAYLFGGHKPKTINLINWDTSNATNMNHMFCETMASEIEGLQYFNTSNVTNMRSMFSHSQATNLNLTSFDTSKVTDMSMMFSCSQSTILDLKNFNTSSVTNMNGMFSASKSIALEMSGFNTSNVTNMSHMFSNSKAANIVGLSDFDTSNVTNMNSMFLRSNAINLDLCKFNTANVISMSGMFAYSQATSLDLSSFNTSRVTDMRNMFFSICISDLDLGNFDIGKVIDMGLMFSCSKLDVLNLNSFDMVNEKNINGMFDRSEIKQILTKTIEAANKFESTLAEKRLSIMLPDDN